MLKIWRSCKSTIGYALSNQTVNGFVHSDRIIGLTHCLNYNYSNKNTKWGYQFSTSQTPHKSDPKNSKDNGKARLSHKSQLLMSWNDILFGHSNELNSEVLLKMLHETDKNDPLSVYSHLQKLSKLCNLTDTERKDFEAAFQKTVLSRVEDLPRSEQLTWYFELNIPAETAKASEEAASSKDNTSQILKEFYFKSKLSPEEIKLYLKSIFTISQLPPSELFKHAIQVLKLSEKAGNIEVEEEIIQNILKIPLDAISGDQVFELYHIIEQLPLEIVEKGPIALIEKCLLQDAFIFAMKPVSSKSALSLHYEEQLLKIIAKVAQARDTHSLYSRFVDEYLHHLIQSRTFEQEELRAQSLRLGQSLLTIAKYSLYLDIPSFEKLENILYELLRKGKHQQEVIETLIKLGETGYLVKLNFNEELSKIVSAISQTNPVLATKIMEIPFRCYITVDETLLKAFDQTILSKISKTSEVLLKERSFWSCFSNYLIVCDPNSSYKRIDWLLTKISSFSIEERISIYETLNNALTDELMSFPSLIYLVGAFENSFQKDWESLQTSHQMKYINIVSGLLSKKCLGHNAAEVAEAKNLKHNPTELYLNKSLHLKEAVNSIKLLTQQNNLTPEECKMIQDNVEILRFYKDKSLNTVASQLLNSVVNSNYNFEQIYLILVRNYAAIAEFFPAILKENKAVGPKIANGIINSASILTSPPKHSVSAGRRRPEEVLESLMFARSAGLISSDTFDSIVVKAHPFTIPPSRMRDLSKIMSKENFANWGVHQFIATPRYFNKHSNLSLEGISWLIAHVDPSEVDSDALSPLLTYLIQNPAAKIQNFVSLVLLTDQSRNELIEYFFKKHLLTQKVLDEFAIQALQLNYLRERGAFEDEVMYSTLKVIRFTPNGIHMFQDIMSSFIFSYIFLGGITDKRILEEAYELLNKATKIKGANQDEGMLILTQKAFSLKLKTAAISPEKLVRDFFKGFHLRSYEQQNELLGYLQWIASQDKETYLYLIEKEDEFLDKIFVIKDQNKIDDALVVERFLCTSYFTFRKRREVLRQVWEYFLKATSLNEMLKMIQVFRILVEKSEILEEDDWVYLISALELFGFYQVDSGKIYRELVEVVSIPNNFQRYMPQLSVIMQRMYKHLPEYEREAIQKEGFQSKQSFEKE